jgi:hypothetical protein
MKLQKKAKPRGERRWPQTERLVSLHFPTAMKELGEDCFVPLSDFNKLKGKYLSLFKRYTREKDRNCD